jgi:hypothetical protein
MQEIYSLDNSIGAVDCQNFASEDDKTMGTIQEWAYMKMINEIYNTIIHNH